MPLTFLLSAFSATAIPVYWVLAIAVVAAVSFVALLNWLLKRVFLGNKLKFLLWLMMVGTIVGAICFGLDALM